VDGLGFDVAAGEIFGLLGPNGAGKTTTLSVLCTLLRPDAGEVRIGGADVLADPAAARRTFGLAPQEIALYPTLTVRENLRYFGRLRGLGGRALEERIDALLGETALSASGDARVERCSGGMKRRANLAAALVGSPPVLFLDEPTAGVDVQSRRLLIDLLRALRGEGTTIVYTTHYLEEAEELCDRVAVVDRGRLVAEGTPGELAPRAGGGAGLEALFLELTGREMRD
jgi:ABC-2 type transport system ATP-binding protein